MNINTNVTNIISKVAITQPHFIFLFIIIIMIATIFSQRMFNITNQYSMLIITLFLVMIIFPVIMSTVFHQLNINDASGHIENFNVIFNSPSSKNCIAIICLLFYIMFVYELPMYDNNAPHSIIDKLTFGHNKYFSNRTVGILAIIAVSLFTCFTVMVTTREIQS